MATAFGALSINGNATPSLVPNVAAKYTQGWAAHSVSQRGNRSVTVSAANSRLTLVPGVYEVELNLTAETEDVSGTSQADAIGVVTFQLRRGGVALAGAVAQLDAQAVDRPQTISIHDIVEITRAHVTAGTNYVEVYHSSGDAAGTDILIANGRFIAKRLS